MKFTIAREAILAPLMQVSGVIEKRQTLPVLGNVLIKLSDGILEMTGTDLEVQLIARTAIDGATDGAVTVPARKLLDICRLLPDQSLLDFEARDDRFNLRSGKSRFNLSTLPADAYPEFDSGSAEFTCSIPASQLRLAMDKTMFAMAQQDVRYYLNGLYLEIDGAVLRAVASDGHRLAYFEDRLPDDAPRSGSCQIIVPRKGVLELARLIGDSDESIDLTVGTNSLRAKLGSLTFAAKLIEGRYPDYQRVMPKDFDRSIEADRDELRGALTRVAVLYNEKFKSITVDIGIDGKMALSAQNPDQEQAEEALDVDFAGAEEPISVGFNALYLLDAINRVEAVRLRMSFTPSANSCLVEDQGDNRYRFVVMPMRL